MRLHGSAFPGMKTIWQLCVICLIVCILSSCATEPPTFDAMVRERISIQIHDSKPVTLVIHARSPGGVATVGIRCSPEVWNSLTGGTGQVEIQLISSRWKGVRIRKEAPMRHGVPDSDTSYYTLFSLLGNYQLFSKVKVEITFPSAPSEVTHGEILVFRMPTDSL